MKLRPWQDYQPETNRCDCLQLVILAARFRPWTPNGQKNQKPVKVRTPKWLLPGLSESE
jgi:hypothetical protein